MRRYALIVGYLLFLLPGIPMLYLYIKQLYAWWGLFAAVAGFIFFPGSYLFPFGYRFLEGSWPTLYLGLWGAGLLGLLVAGIAQQD